MYHFTSIIGPFHKWLMQCAILLPIFGPLVLEGTSCWKMRQTLPVIQANVIK